MLVRRSVIHHYFGKAGLFQVPCWCICPRITSSLRTIQKVVKSLLLNSSIESLPPRNSDEMIPEAFRSSKYLTAVMVDSPYIKVCNRQIGSFPEVYRGENMFF